MADASLRTAVLLVSLCLTTVGAQDPWLPTALMRPAQLAAELKAGNDKPPVIFVGFPVLYRAAHIRSAIMAGPASTSEGMATLKNAVAGLPKDRQIVIYCGCCPFTQCPNVRPAYKALRHMGFQHVRVLELDSNLHSDWVGKGYPVERGQ